MDDGARGRVARGGPVPDDRDRHGLQPALLGVAGRGGSRRTDVHDRHAARNQGDLRRRPVLHHRCRRRARDLPVEGPPGALRHGALHRGHAARLRRGGARATGRRARGDHRDEHPGARDQLDRYPRTRRPWPADPLPGARGRRELRGEGGALPVSLGPGDGRVQPSRADRADASLRRRRIYGIVVLVAIVVAGVAAIQLGDGGGGAAADSPSPSGSSPTASTPTDLLALSVTGAPHALLAAVGTGSGLPPAGLVLPPGMTVVVPGQGETVTEDVQTLPGESMRVGVSNALGTWADHYAVMDLRDLGRGVDDAGGISANLADAYPVGGTVLGPGETHMNGDQVVRLLSEQADDADLRWAAVLEGFLGAQPTVSRDRFTESDDAAAAASILGSAGGAEVQVGPTHVVGGTAIVPQQPDFDQL